MRKLAVFIALLGAPSLAGLDPHSAAAQAIRQISPDLLQEVMPEAERFSEGPADPPVIEGFAVDSLSGAETLVGYVFVTSDLPPEAMGYSAPIRVLVGMDLEGIVTGIEVLDYRESLRRSRGDFLNRGSYLSQFPGKHVSEPFQIRNDVDGISGASITTSAMARGIRNAARRVAAAYLMRAPEGTPTYIGTIASEQLEQLLWVAMIDQGLVAQVDLLDDPNPMLLTMLYLRDPSVGVMMIGEEAFQGAMDELGPRENDHLMIMTLSGNGSFYFRPSQLSFVQDGDTTAVATEDLAILPIIREGKLQGEVRRSALLWVDGSLDLGRPIEVVLDLRNMSPPGNVASGIYTVLPPRAVASTPPESEPEAPADPASVEVAGADPTDADAAGGATDAVPAIDAAATANAATTQQIDPGAAPILPAPDASAPLPEVTPPPETDYGALLLEDEAEEESALARVLERTSWSRVTIMLLLLALATWAFVSKRNRIRWAALGATLLVLGWVDGGFLSVSHIMAGISVGPSVYLSDIPLLLLVTFTVVTTLLFGRVFCGFLCPFGALQDVLERIVPKRFRRELPRAIHEKALWIKYGILALVLAPVVVGSSLSLFQYFEPFGTVFFWSSSILLWSIAGAILIASAIVPRFYCRYACPLGAALAVGSLVAPFRIRRVEQCDLCKVCEQKCPTGAIEGPRIDFKECVRCNVCEIQLIEKTGVCKHDMESIRPRLVKLPMVSGNGGGAPWLAGDNV